MIRSYDQQVQAAEALVKINRTAYVAPETVEMAKTIVRMQEDIEYLQHEIERLMPIIVAFRHWRAGVTGADDMMTFLRSDEAGRVLSLEDHKWARERQEKISAKWKELLR